MIKEKKRIEKGKGKRAHLGKTELNDASPEEETQDKVEPQLPDSTVGPRPDLLDEVGGLLR